MFGSGLQAQETPERCATMGVDQLLRQQNPRMGTLDDFEAQVQQWIEQQRNSRTQGGVLQLPVVVHVIHEGQAVGTGLNISDAQVQSQIDVLNEDFRRKAGTRGFNTDPNGADTEIEFILARRAPDGTATNGIDRVNAIERGWPAAGFLGYSTAFIDGTIKPATIWDPNQYVNFWVCDLGPLILGYAQFPAASIPGMDECSTPNANTDGVVMTTTYFGSEDAEPNPGAFNLANGVFGRTTTHEIGHWLGLRHTWGDGNCNVDDFCEDTPNVSGQHYQSCNTTTGAPIGAVPLACDGVTNRMIENYMDYSDDACMNIFTQDQKLRMRSVLLNSPLRRTLINSLALVPPTANDAAMASIESPVGAFCNGTSIAPQVTFINKGTNNLTAVTINYQLDNDPINTFSWTGTLATGAEQQVTLPAITPSAGPHTLTVFTTLPNGVADTQTARDTIRANFTMSFGRSLPFTENFESNAFPPADWAINNVDKDCGVWSPVFGITGVDGNTTSSAHMNFFGYEPGNGQIDELYTPPIDLYNAGAGTELKFDVAHIRYNNSNDRLRVEISADCGQTWEDTPIYDKSGAALATAGASTNSWQPTLANDWRTETINLDAYRGQQIKLRFVTVNDYGNNLYVDNIRVDAPIIPCAITGITAGAQTACDPTTNTYTQQLTITYQSLPRDGNLIVNGQSFVITGSPQTITLTGLVSDGNPVNVTATSSVDPACTFTQNAAFLAPNNCQSVQTTLTTTAGSPTNQSPLAFTVTFSASVTGFVAGDVSVTNGTVSNFINVNGTTYTFDVIPTVSGTVTVQVPADVAQNASGVSNTASSPVSLVFDNVAPTMVCQNFTAVLNAFGGAFITPANVDGGSTDNIAITNLTVTPSAFTCANAGTNTVILTGTDAAGNSASCTAIVTVVDQTAPSIACPANQSVTVDGTCGYNLPDYTGLATATDNCG
ncbi:MAG: M43 family zinc metalloprotease, partial [Bernardetiaceae bacterium]